jgi:hypothetical protein
VLDDEDEPPDEDPFDEDFEESLDDPDAEVDDADDSDFAGTELLPVERLSFR